MSHDARILRQLSEVGCEIPFVLLHRTGFMTSFVELCYTLVTSGMNFYNLESMIIERRWSNYAKKMKVVSDTCTLQDCSSENFLQSCLANSPSNSILTQCFIAICLTLRNICTSVKWKVSILAPQLALTTHSRLLPTLDITERTKYG